MVNSVEEEIFNQGILGLFSRVEDYDCIIAKSALKEMFKKIAEDDPLRIKYELLLREYNIEDGN